MSKYWKDMYIDQNKNLDFPVSYTDNDKIKIIESIDNIDETSEFYRQNNKMSTGNTTLLPPSTIQRFLSLPHYSVQIRSQQDKLMGTVMSLILPTILDGTVNKYGFTTFLNVHKSVRGFGLCMALIRRLTELGHKDEVYSGCQVTSFKLGENNIPINSWYRPINLKKCKKLGFLYPNYDNPKLSRKTRLRYKTILSPEIKYTKGGNLKFYLNYMENKFGFYPDEKLWKIWCNSFPTYTIYKTRSENKKEDIVGLISINPTHCIIESSGLKGKLLIPFICIGEMEYVIPAMNKIAEEEEYDAVYCHEHGDLVPGVLDRFKFIKTTTTLYFTLYNSKMNLTPDQIYVPLI